MADVHAGRDIRLERDVAIKLLRPEVVARQPEVRTRFEAEARTAARLGHPNVVAVYDTGEHEGLPFIVMERLPGETLADRIRGGPVDLEWLRRVAGDVLGALGAAHAAGMVHRDVKPGNILLADDGRAKVADFGIAKSVDGTGPDLTATNLLIGTPAYLAPEQVAGEPATARSDLYALGVVLYEAASGRKPFTGDTPVAVAYAIEHAEVEPLAARRPDVDGALSATVERAMERDPARRFGSATEMAAALGLTPAGDPTIEEIVPPVVEHDPTMVAAAPLVTSGRRRPPRWAAPALAAVAVLLIALVAGALLSDGDDGATPVRADAPETTEATAGTRPADDADEADTTTTRAELGEQIRAQVEERLDDAGVDLGTTGDDGDDEGKGKGKAKGRGDG
jgi:serine/threonine-protein kinase